MRRFFHLVVTLLLLVSGPLSVPGLRVEKAARALAEAVESHAFEAKAARATLASKSGAAKTGNGARGALTVADVGDEATRSLSGKVRSAARANGGWLAMMSQALRDVEISDNDEIDTADLPDDFDGDSCQPSWSLITFTELQRPPGPAATLVEPNLWGIQPSIGHPLGVDEPPRV